VTGGNVPDRASFVGINRERWKRAMVEHFRELGFTHALTLAWNQSRSHDKAVEDLKAVHWRVDRKLFGRHFVKMSSLDRTLAVFVFEGVMPGGHLHVHSLWRLRSSAHLLPFARLFPAERGGIWNNVAPAGSHKLAIADDWSTFAGYALKDQRMSSEARQIVWSGDFYRI
jgi:hypothetical protein